MTSKWMERSSILLACGRNGWKKRGSYGNHTIFLITYFGDVHNVNANRMKQLLNNLRRCFESRISVGATEKLPAWEKPHARSVAWSNNKTCSKMRWKILRTGKQEVEQLYKVSSPCLDDHNSRRKSLNQLENYQKYAHKLSWNTDNWHELPPFYVCQQSCKRSHQIESSLRQTFGKIDFIHSLHKWLPTKKSCG